MKYENDQAGRPRAIGVAALSTVVGGALMFGITMSVALAQVEIDASKVMGVGKCTDCHGHEVEAWKKTKHATTVDLMHRNKNAGKIIKALGIGGRIKTNDVCYKCHYTVKVMDGKREIDSGVSCESCHGAARDWVSPELHHEDASKAEGDAKDVIYRKCEAAGMLRPANVYNVARNCFSCHTVPDEKLVNLGGHTAGSNFELVSWSQGEVRHNFQHAGGKENRKASAERRRVLYVVGALTDLEYGLRGVSKATENGTYVNKMVSRVNRALGTLDKIAKADIPEVTEALTAVPRRKDGRVLVKLTTAKTLAAVAAKVSAATEKFSRTNDGSTLSALDGMVPTKTQGTAHE